MGSVDGVGSATVGIALLGLGRIGRVHALNLSRDPRSEIRWIVEEFVEGARDFVARKLGSCRCTHAGLQVQPQVISAGEVDQVWSDPKTHAIVVCTPSDTHRKLILGGIAAGKAVFCEKPLAPDLPSVMECYERATSAGQILYCGFQRRFDPSIRELRDRVKAGEIGSIRSIQAVSRDPSVPSLDYLRHAGDLYHDSAVHDIDMVSWIIGEAPLSVFAQGHSFHPHTQEVGDVDETVVVLKFPSGAMATIHLSRETNFGYDQRLEVLGSRGMLQMDNRRGTSVSLHNAGGSTASPPLPFFLERYQEAYRLEMVHFLDLVEDQAGIHQEVGRGDVIETMQISDLCSASSKTGVVMQYKAP